MARILLLLATLGLFTAVMAGCHAEGDIDTAASIPVVQ